MKRHGVVVTGLGAVSALSVEVNQHFERLRRGDSALERLDDHRYRNYPPLWQARVHGFDRRERIPHRMLRKLLSPSAAYAQAAAGQALRDGGISQGDGSLADCGLYVGSVCLDANPEAFIPALRDCISVTNQIDLARFATHGMKLLDPLFLVKSLPNAGLCGIAIQYQVLGPNLNLTNGAASGLQAVIAAVAAIERGETAIALAGGYDTLLQMDSIVEHLLAGRLAVDDGSARRPDGCFSTAARGYALGEGAAFVLLEDEARARARGAYIYGSVLGSGQSCCTEGWPQTRAPGAEELVRTARDALNEADMCESRPDAIFGDGLAVAADDAREIAAWRQVSGSVPIPLTAPTAAIGFTGAASGVFSLVHACLSMRHSVIPPVIGDEDHDAVPELFRREVTRPVNRTLVWNSDRGVKNAAIVMGPPPSVQVG